MKLRTELGFVPGSGDKQPPLKASTFHIYLGAGVERDQQEEHEAEKFHTLVSIWTEPLTEQQGKCAFIAGTMSALGRLQVRASCRMPRTASDGG